VSPSPPEAGPKHAIWTRDQAAAAVTAAVAERDTIQANLLELDGSFGKRLLAGAKLAGETRKRWDTAAAELTRLWEIFNAYSAVIDRAVEVLPTVRRSPSPALTELTTILNEPSVRLAHASSALARGDLTGTADTTVTLAAALREMRGAFAVAARVVAAAETVWNAMSDQLQQVAADLGAARQRAGGIADDALANALALAETDLGQLRDVVNSDPLALWQDGQVDTARLGRLRERAAAAVSRAAELAALRENAGQRIAAVAVTVSAAREAWQDAMAAREAALTKVAGELPGPPDVHGLAGQLAALDSLNEAGRWSRLASELDLLEEQAAAAATGCRDAERQATALLDRRAELRGLLDAYQAKAVQCGGAEDSGLEECHDRARDLLWTAPCDLPAAADAVVAYQQAVLEFCGRRLRA